RALRGSPGAGGGHARAIVRPRGGDAGAQSGAFSRGSRAGLPAAMISHYKVNLFLDYDSRLAYRFASLTHRGASSGYVPKVERGVASGDRGSVTATREVRDTARQALRPGREELAAGSSGGNAGNRSASLPKNATVERREVRVPSPRDARRLASAWPAAPEAW